MNAWILWDSQCLIRDSLFLQVRRLNLYVNGESTPYNQILDQFTLDRCWAECLSRSSYQERRAAINLYNR